MIKEDFSYPKEEMDKLIVTDGTNKAAIWTDNGGDSICYDFYTEPMKKFSDDEEERLDYKCARIRIPKVDYSTIVSAIIEMEYSNDKVQALTSNYLLTQDPVVEISDDKKAEYTANWLKFQELRMHAKAIAALVSTVEDTAQ